MWRPAGSGAAYPGAMDTTNAPATLRLERGTVHSLHLGAGCTLVLAAGRIWLTEPGDLEDHFLAAGQTHRVGRGGRVVIEGDSAETAVVRLSGRASAPRPAAPGPIAPRARRA